MHMQPVSQGADWWMPMEKGAETGSNEYSMFQNGHTHDPVHTEPQRGMYGKSVRQ